MVDSWLQTVLPVLGLALNVPVQIVCYRLTKGYLPSIVIGFAAGLAGLACAEIWTVPRVVTFETVGLATANLLIYGALGYGYFHFLNLGETARRVRLLRELHEAGGALSEGEILARYNARMIVGVRIQRLLESGQVVRRDGQFHIGKPGLLTVARALDYLKRILLGKGQHSG